MIKGQGFQKSVLKTFEEYKYFTYVTYVDVYKIFIMYIQAENKKTNVVQVNTKNHKLKN